MAMDRRSLMMGVAIGAGVAGLVFAGVTRAQADKGAVEGVGTYQVATCAAGTNSSMETRIVILNTRTGKYKVQAAGNTGTFEFKD